MGGNMSQEDWDKITMGRYEVKTQIEKVLNDKDKKYFIIETLNSENTILSDYKAIENMELIVSYLLSTKNYVTSGSINSTVIPVGRGVRCIYHQVILKQV